MTRPCKIGVQLPEVERRVAWPELIAMAQRAEAVGFDSLWLGDHLVYDLPDGSERGPWEVWTSLAALAVATERIELGPLVASLGFHEPAMLAKQAATVDAISGGRLVVGVGAGWNEREYRAFGFPFDHRVERFGEALSIVARLLRGDRVDHTGRRYRVENLLLDPPPVRPGGPPLLVGSIGPKMLGSALPYVSAWNVWFSQFGNTVDGFAAIRDRVGEIVRANGRDPDDVEATAAILVEAPGGRGRTMGEPVGRQIDPIRGTPEQIASALAAFAAAGARHLQLVVDPITEESIAWLGDALAALDA